MDNDGFGAMILDFQLLLAIREGRHTASYEAPFQIDIASSRTLPLLMLLGAGCVSPRRRGPFGPGWC